MKSFVKLVFLLHIGTPKISFVLPIAKTHFICYLKSRGKGKEPVPALIKNKGEKQMNVYLDKDFFAKPDRSILGYVGETNTREVVFKNLSLEGADSFSCVLEYEDGVKYEVPIEQQRFVVTGSLLRYPQKVKCQVLAKAQIERTDAYRLVKKSNIFLLDIAPSITGEPAPVPSYEESLSLLDQIRQIIDSGGVTTADITSIITGVLTSAIAADIEQEES